MLKLAFQFFVCASILSIVLISANAQDTKPAAPKPITLSTEDRQKLELLQKDLEILELRRKLLETQAQNLLTSSLRTAGVADADFGKYTYNSETFTFTPKK